MVSHKKYNLNVTAWPHQVVLGQDSGLEKPGWKLRAG
jgi:hypothetical protein